MLPCLSKHLISSCTCTCTLILSSEKKRARQANVHVYHPKQHSEKALSWIQTLQNSSLVLYQLSYMYMYQGSSAGWAEYCRQGNTTSLRTRNFVSRLAREQKEACKASKYMYIHDKSKQGKYIHPEQLSLFSKKKLPWVGFEPTTLRVLGERSTN